MSYYLLIEPPNNVITEDELYHHGILGQKWGIRRFQPYRIGMKVAGGKVVGAAKKVKQRVTGAIEGIKEHRAAKKEAKIQKKAEAARKAAEAHQLSKEEAINKGTVEDLAKFKGELTGEEYRRAFDRLGNEATLQRMIDANKKSGWDIIDDGMKIVDRLGKYANTAANFKQNVDRLTQGSKDEKDKKEQNEKYDALNKIKSVTELNDLQKKYHFNQDEYNKALNTFANKKAYQDRFKDDDDFVDQNDKARREYESERQKANESAWAKKTADEQWEQYKKSMYRDYQKARRADSNRAKDGSWRPYDDEPSGSSNSSKSAENHRGGGFREERWGTRPSPATNQLLLTMKDSTPSSSSVNSGKRVISGFTSPGSKNYKVTSQLEFGGSKVTRATAQSSKPSSSLEATRRAVEATKRERDRQREIEEKRKRVLRHSALDCTVDELYHHGIKGQKWGVRRFQDESGRLTAAGKDRAKTRRLIDSKKSITEGRSYVENSRFTYKVDLDTYEAEERRMPDGRIIYPAVATVIKDCENAGFNPYPGPKGFDGLYDRVNPGYGEPGTTNNCPFVGVAMEVASRGYDVVARRSLGGASVGVFRHYFKGADTQKCDTWDEMLGDLNSMPDGASGVLQGYYGDGLGSGCGGHTLHWRKEGSNMIVADGQCHRELSLQDTQKEYGFGSKGCFYTRLDNCEPDWDTLAADGVLGVNNGGRRIVSKSNSDTVLPNRAWDAKPFYGYDDVQGYRR